MLPCIALSLSPLEVTHNDSILKQTATLSIQFTLHVTNELCVTLCTRTPVHCAISDTHEPRHDKTNKMSVRPKTQISLGIRPVWSESSAWAKDPSFPCGQRRLWSDWTDTHHAAAHLQAFFMRTAKTLIRLGGCKADLSLRWAHTHFVFDVYIIAGCWKSN